MLHCKCQAVERTYSTPNTFIGCLQIAHGSFKLIASSIDSKDFGQAWLRHLSPKANSLLGLIHALNIFKMLEIVRSKDRYLYGIQKRSKGYIPTPHTAHHPTVFYRADALPGFL